MKHSPSKPGGVKIAGLFQARGTLPEIPREARERVLSFIRNQPEGAVIVNQQKKSRRVILIPIIALAAAAVAAGVVIVLALPAAGGRTTASGTSAGSNGVSASGGVLVSENIRPTFDRAVFTFCVGNVEISDGASGDDSASGGGAWRQAEIGGYAGGGQRIRTGAESSCELQFADRAIVRLDERTEVAVERVAAESGRTDIGLTAATGRILCKAAKIADPEYFQVRTKAAVCGVRGTQFAVKVNSGGETTVSTREGSVYLLPAAADPGELKKRLTGMNEALRRRLDRLKSLAPSVAAGKEAVLSGAYASAVAAPTAAFVQGIDALLSQKSIAGADPDELDALVDAFAKRLKAGTPAPRPIPREAADDLAPLDSAAYLWPAGESAAAAAPVVRVELAVSPGDADIEFAGGLSGRGLVRCLAAAGDKLDFTVSRDGYKQASFRVDVTEGMGPLSYEMVEIRAERDSHTTALPSLTPRPTSSVSPSPQVSPGDPRDFFDDFNTDTLAPRWRWVYESKRNWSLTDKPGYLTMYTQAGEIRDNDSGVRNILLQALPEGDFRMETKLEFRPRVNWHQAGLFLYIDDDSFIKLDWVMDNEPKVEMANEVDGGFSTELTPYAPSTPIVYLRITRKGDVYSGFYSMDGRTYTLVHTYRRNWGAELRGGFWAVGGHENNVRIPASFDYFRLTYGE